MKKVKKMNTYQIKKIKNTQKKTSFIKQMIGFRPQIAIIALLIITVIASVYYTFRTQAATAWPLKVSSNGRYLVDQNNKPFLYTADTAWSSLSSLSVASAKQLIDIRQSQGFNVIMASATGFSRTQGGPNGTPFQGDDLTKPNESYFKAVDELVKYAESKDMVVMMGALWMANNGGRGGGRLPSSAELQSFGTFLGNRYKSFGNIVWFVGGDDEPSRNLDAVKTLANAINAADPNHLITYHTWNKAYNVKSEPWLDFNSFQWNSNSAPYSYADVTEGYGQTPVKPVFDMEPAYEPKACCGSDMDTSLQENRRNGWWAILSGAMGVAYGGPSEAWNAQEPLNTGALNRPSATHTGNIRKILEPFPWQRLVPNNSIVTGGGSGSDQMVAGRADDGSLIVAYTPSSKTLTVDMSKLSGPAQAYWFNPATAAKTDAGANLANSGSKSFTPSVGGDGDAVLILTTGAQSMSTSPSTPPQVSPTTIIPTFACLGTAPCVPTATPTPPGGVVPTIANPTSSVAPSGTTNPTGVVIPPQNDPNGNNGNNGNNGRKGGIIALFLTFLRSLLELLLSLFR